MIWIPCVLIALLSGPLDPQVAFKVVSASGLFALPLSAWGAFRVLRFREPAPTFAALATLPFLFMTSYTIYGGNIASTMAGEFPFSVSFALLPISAVYYPVSVLPVWLQYVAYAMPPAYSFEGMRSILLHGVVRYDLMAAGFALNIVYLALGVAMFFHYFRMARRRGSLLQQGE